MKFNKTVRRQNANFDKQVAAKEECLKVISEIDQYLDYVDDPSEYEQVKKQVQTFEPAEYEDIRLSDESQQILEAKLNHLYELAESLK